MMDRRSFLNLGCKSLASLLLLSQISGCSFLNPRKIIKGSMEMEGLRLTDHGILAEEAMYYTELDNEKVRCDLCFRGCMIEPGNRGYCGVRKNSQGKLYSLVYGNMATVTVGPVEKKPLHQYKPGAQANNYGTAGCNLGCLFCHNWRLSQQKLEELDGYDHFLPEEAIDYATYRNVQLLSFTYNEPTVFYEFMLETAKLARKAGLGVNVNTNAMLQKEPLRELFESADSATVDLKGFSQEFYREVCEGELQPVLDNLKLLKEMGIWVEVVNLIIPGLNDDEKMIKEMSRWLYEELGPETPLHVNRFMPAYRLQNISPTPVGTLEKARKIAVDQGLDYVYLGNVPGHTFNSTFCPECNSIVIQRHHFSIREMNIKDGKCKNCGYQIAGIW